MKKVVRLTESDLIRLVKKINEQLLPSPTQKSKINYCSLEQIKNEITKNGFKLYKESVNETISYEFDTELIPKKYLNIFGEKLTIKQKQVEELLLSAAIFFSQPPNVKNVTIIEISNKLINLFDYLYTEFEKLYLNDIWLRTKLNAALIYYKTFGSKLKDNVESIVRSFVVNYSNIVFKKTLPNIFNNLKNICTIERKWYGDISNLWQSLLNHILPKINNFLGL